MSNLIPCEFFVVRYVPDVIKQEFVNIGIVLRTAAQDEGVKREAQVRFTRNWKRVLCLDPDVDINLLVALEDDWTLTLASQQADWFVSHLGDLLSNSIQMTEPRASLAQDLDLELNKLVSLYVDSGPQIATQLDRRRDIALSMRSQFQDAGVWSQMQKRIPASQYTQPGDPMRLDCGYRFDSTFRIFHAVSFRGWLTAAKALAYSAPLISEGVLAKEFRTLELVAVIETPGELFKRSEQGELSEQAQRYYRFGVELLERQGVRVMPTSSLPRAVEAAKAELHM